MCTTRSASQKSPTRPKPILSPLPHPSSPHLEDHPPGNLATLLAPPPCLLLEKGRALSVHLPPPLNPLTPLHLTFQVS
ncbi:hypothetical protein ID866_6299 [Astraeus odoratus]|nr:hypothetical protein ID866_6299 [Astraeus odoratus]